MGGRKQTFNGVLTTIEGVIYSCHLKLRGAPFEVARYNKKTTRAATET